MRSRHWLGRNLCAGSGANKMAVDDDRQFRRTTLIVTVMDGGLRYGWR